MRKTLQRIFVLPGLWVLLASVIGLGACQKIDSDSEQPGTRAAAEHLIVGSIQESMTISAASADYVLTIPSARPASCVTGSVIYLWEIMQQDSSWREFPFSDNEFLITNPPLQEVVYYRRKAVCGHEMGYSNVCRVVNIGIPSAGTIAPAVDLNRGGFSIYLHIPSRREPSAGATVGWQEYVRGAWVDSSFSNSNDGNYYMPERRIAKFRRTATKDDITAYSNECTVTDHAYYDDPGKGSSFDNKIDLGTYSDNFIVSGIVDTSKEYFWDQDRLTFCGNDAFMTLVLTRPMVVDFRTGSLPIGVWLTVWKETEDWEGYLYTERTSVPYALRPNVDGLIPYRDFGIEDEFAPQVTLELSAGEYTIHLQGTKTTNGGAVNALIGVNIRGTVL